MPILCAFVPAYKVAVARLGDERLRERPLIVADRLERGHALELDAEAYALGARPGMTLVQAAACAREAAIVVDEPARNRVLWERALDALDAASPLVEDAAEGTAFLDMRGIAGSERRRLESVRDAFASDPDLARLPLHVALAPNKFVARTAALVRDGHVVHAGDERAFVAPLPLEVLGLDRATLERLELFGVANLRTLAALPHGPFVRRFGPQAARWHALAGGVDETPLVPRTRHVTIDRSLYGEGTAEREDQVLFALRTLVARVADDVAYAGKRCGILRLALECEDGECVALASTLAQPSAQAATMFDLLRARLEGVVLQSPVIGLRLAAERLESGGSELSLFASRDPDPEIVGIALARLEAALGPGNALRASVVAGNRYEARAAYEPFTAAGIARSTRAAVALCEPQAPVATLAYRIVTPRALDVRLKNGRPARIGSRDVLEVAGPWRVDEAWWAEALDTGNHPLQSDAYDVLLDDGALCRIVCERDRWYLCGTYD
jgi:nucleotidyltransferase/DNA polymerase involved in DNA repair